MNVTELSEQLRAATPHLICVALCGARLLPVAFVCPLLGGASAFSGFCVAYRYDLPVGPTEVVLLGLVYGMAFLVKKTLGLIKAKPMDADRPASVQTSCAEHESGE